MSLLSCIMLLLQAITLLVIGWLIKSYFPSYFSEKGKNLATKEDVGRITDEVERVRLLYAVDLERTKNELQQGIELTKHQLSRALETSNRREDLRIQAYVDFIKGVTGITIAQRTIEPSSESEYVRLLADAKVRIAIYGSKEVAELLAYFVEEHGALTNDSAMRSLVDVIRKMREENGPSIEQISIRAISQLLFSSSLSDEATCSQDRVSSPPSHYKLIHTSLTLKWSSPCITVPTWAQSTAK